MASVPHCLVGRGVVGFALLAGLALPAGAGAAPIPSSGPPTTLPSYSGHAAVRKPIHGVRRPFQNRFMAPNPFSEIHNDAWQTDAYRHAGPLGRSPRTFSNLIGRLCGSIAFDSRGRLVSVCIGGDGPRLFMFDPKTLDVLAQFALPPRAPPAPGTSLFQDFTGGGYFFLDNRDRVWSATTTRHVWVIAERRGSPGFVLRRDYDLSRALRSDERITSALPDASGRIWFVAKRNGVVGTIARRSGRIRLRRLGRGRRGEIENSFATASHDVYVATNRKLYRFRAGRGGRPRIVWKARYRNSGLTKPGQVDDGTGTTPTVLQGGYVAITDNDDPMNVVVYRTAVHPRHGRRLFCRIPVFRRGASATENSLIGAGRSLIVENNYGYRDPFGAMSGALTEPGFARVDIKRGGRGCRRRWTNRTERAPTVVPKLSLAAGLIYAYTRPPDPGGSQPYFWTALDFRTGRRVWRQLAGTGLNYNNNYAGIAIGRDGTAYLGTLLGGIVAIHDG